ncbi:MAG TPA: exonuclease domain-containing protein [Methylophilaceae bacterium]|nr:exonuclease domain-containing protein [Methylophilaceae bacterium]
MNWLPDLLFLDIETTGASHINDRITEVALIKIQDGEVTSWQSLINPEVPVPRNITNLTGITDAMVADAPTFKEIAAELYSHLEGAVMVAHNSRFDYGFLKAEYKRMGGTLRLRTICTVKLSRKLYPLAKGHSLDAIMQRHGLSTTARHRGMGDVQLMLDFLEAAKQDLGSVAVLEAIAEQMRGPALPASLDASFLERIKDVPGVYIFFDEGGSPLYVGKSIKLRTRVLNHFASDHTTHTEMEMALKIRKVEWRETAGELGALLLESELVKQLRPAYNRQLRSKKKLYAIRLADRLNQIPWVKVITTQDFDPTDFEYLYGIWKSKKAANEVIRNLADEFQLCSKLLGLEAGKGVCFSFQVQKCTGVCVGQEKHELHHLRLRNALVAHKLKGWPYKGRVGIREVNPETGKTEVHLFEHWCHLDTVASDGDMEEALNAKYELEFDLDAYRLIVKALGRAEDIIEFGYRESRDLMEFAA